MKQIFTFLLGSLILSGAYSSLHASGGGGAAAPAEQVTQKTGLKALLSELQHGEITPMTEVTTLLPRLSGLSHDEIKSFLDAFKKKEVFSELSKSLRNHIMFVSYYVKDEEDAMKDPREFISQQDVFQRITDDPSYTRYFNANALYFYKAIINPEEAGRVALYKYSEEEPFFIIAWIHRSGYTGYSFRYTAHYWAPGNTHNSLFFGDENIQNIYSLYFGEVQRMRGLMGTKIKDPRAFIESFFNSTIQDRLFNKFHYKHILPWAFEDLVFQNGGAFSRDICWIVNKIAEIDNADIRAALEREVKTHRFFSKERRDAVKLFLLINNRIFTTKGRSSIPIDNCEKILGFL